jgi:hypothetical protein
LGGENRNNAREKPEAKTRIGNIESKSDWIKNLVCRKHDWAEDK